MAIVDGVAYWASVTTPNTTYEPVYSINVVVDNEVADDFRGRGFTVKDKEEGPTIVVKRKVHGPNGMIRTAPKLIDNMKNEMDCQIGKVAFNYLAEVQSEVQMLSKKIDVLNAAAKTYNGMLQENLDPEALIAEEDQAES